MKNLELKNLQKIDAIEPLTDEEVEWDLINHSTSGVYVKHTLKELDPFSETISAFVAKHFTPFKPVKKINELADSRSAPMWVYEISHGERVFKVAKTMTLCSLLKDEVYDWELDKIMVGFFIVGIPGVEGTTVQTDLDDIEWIIPVFAAQLCADFVQALTDGDCLMRAKSH